ncbi:MAG: SDR family oxidoreductase [Nocardioides sp.]
MDLGIAGRWALVCAASKGLGKGCAKALAAEGVNVVITARGVETLIDTAEELRTECPDVEVVAVPGDIATKDGRQSALKSAPHIDILVTNVGGPPAGDFRDKSREDWDAAIGATMLTPIELMKATVDSMARRGFGRVVNITSSAVKAPIDILGLSNAARAGLTGFVGGTARQVRLASRGVTINNLLPGSFDTDRLQVTLGANADQTGRTLADVRATSEALIPIGRFGTPEEFGAVCAFLCSMQAGYLTGQNILLDGGAYPGLI